MLMEGTAGIAASNYSQVHQFPSRAAYNDYFDRVVDIGEVGVPEFADRVQELLVDYIHIHTAFFQQKRHFFPAAKTPTVSNLRSDSSVVGRTY